MPPDHVNLPRHFVIDQVSWHTSIPGNSEPRDHTIARMHAVARFLEDSGLTVRSIVVEPEQMQDSFAIHTMDLTEEGFALIRAAYDAWLRRIDRGMSYTDVSVLEKALKKIRARK